MQQVLSAVFDLCRGVDHTVNALDDEKHHGQHEQDLLSKRPEIGAVGVAVFVDSVGLELADQLCDT